MRPAAATNSAASPPEPALPSRNQQINFTVSTRRNETLFFAMAYPIEKRSARARGRELPTKPARPAALAASGSGPNNATRALRVLVVDDDELFRACIRAFLVVESHVEIVGEAGDGKEAIHLVDRLKPEVVLLDVDMPRMDGLTAARVLSARSRQPAIVVLTGASSAQREQEAFAAGARAVIAKGDEEQLHGTLTALRQMLLRPARSDARLAAPETAPAVARSA